MCPRRSPTAYACWSCPTATAPRTLHRSRPCCSPPRSTSIWSGSGRVRRRRLIIETGDAREVPHIATLIGYGAAAVNPYLALETVDDLIATGALTGMLTPEAAAHNMVAGLGKGVLKIMSKMGISTVTSYCGAQVFEAIGLDAALTARYFTGTASRIGGVGLDGIAAEVAARHAHAYPQGSERGPASPPAGDRRRICISGSGTARCTCSTRRRCSCCSTPRGTGQYDVFKSYTSAVDELAGEAGSLRGLFELGPASSRRCRWPRSNRRARSSSGSRPAR